MNDYKKVSAIYSEDQLNKAHEIVSEMLECAQTAAAEESNFERDVQSIKVVQTILEHLINED